jgi:hypothetical protein
MVFAQIFRFESPEPPVKRGITEIQTVLADFRFESGDPDQETNARRDENATNDSYEQGTPLTRVPHEHGDGGDYPAGCAQQAKREQQASESETPPLDFSIDSFVLPLNHDQPL